MCAEKERAASLERKLDRVGCLTSQIATSSQEQLILQKSAASLAQAAGFIWYLNMIFKKNLQLALSRMVARWRIRLTASPATLRSAVMDYPEGAPEGDPRTDPDAVFIDLDLAPPAARPERSMTEPGLFTASLEDLLG